MKLIKRLREWFKEFMIDRKCKKKGCDFTITNIIEYDELRDLVSYNCFNCKAVKMEEVWF